MLHKNRDLLLIYLITVISAGLAISWLHTVPWLAIFGIALALFLPGYVFSQLIMPVLPVEERILVSLGLSIVITGLSGLILNLTALGMNAITWGLWLAALTLVGTGWVWLRRESKPVEVERVVLPARRSIPWRSLALMGFALACVLLAFQISDSFSNRLNTPLTALWAAYEPSDSLRMNVGVRNLEGRPMSYDLVIQTNAQGILQRQRIEVEDEKTYSLVINFQQAGQQPVQVLLYLPEVPNQPYRQVIVAPQGGALQAQGSSR